jgi:hypothetical protein
MPLVCTACRSEHRTEIDRMITGGTGTERSIAKRFGLSNVAVHRHKAHVTARLAAAVERREAKSGDDLLDRLQTLNAEALAILRESRRSGKNETALRAIGRASDLLELEARILGEIHDRSITNLGVFVLDERKAIRVAEAFLLSRGGGRALAPAGALDLKDDAPPQEQKE